jgi:hypothetical protein
MTTLLTLTELEAVNLMMSVIGESPVSSLGTPGLVDLTIARAILDETVREVQERGWEFNTDATFPLVRDVNNFIPVPPNALKLEMANASKHLDCVLRNGRLYDRGNLTYLFLESVWADVTWLLTFEDMPQSMRQYVAIRSARKFQRRMLGLDTLDKLSEAEEMEALAGMLNQTGLPVNVLNDVSREVQEKGWAFNTESNYLLTPDGEGVIAIADYVLRVDTMGASEDLDVVVRNRRLYDRGNRTFVFPGAIRVEIVWLLPFVDLPIAARNYIHIRASRRFHRLLGLTQERYTEQDEATALAALEDQDCDTGLPGSVLHTVSREVQEKGWSFNTESNYLLTPDGDGFITLTNDVLRVDTMGASSDVDAVIRNYRLYDRGNHTYVFPAAIRVEIVWLLPFVELPAAARNYIQIKATRRFHRLRRFTQERYTEQDEATALAALQDQDCDAGDYNILTGNYDVYRLLER